MRYSDKELQDRLAHFTKMLADDTWKRYDAYGWHLDQKHYQEMLETTKAEIESRNSKRKRLS